MSSLIFYAEESQVLMATDTLATSLDGKPFKFTTKAFFLPHLQMLVAATGAGGFLGPWLARLNDGMIVRGIDLLNDHAPRNLDILWRGQKHQLSLTLDASVTVYHVGFSEVTGTIHVFAYRSANRFQSEPLPYGLHVKPECRIPAPFILPKDIQALMEAQRTIQAALPPEQRIYIGGEMEVHHLTKNGCHAYTLARFADYASDETAIYENFAAAKKQKR